MNAEDVLGQLRAAKKWSPATVTRMLRNEKYAGRWVWNRTETRRDPTTGRRRKFPKPESVWLVTQDDALRIVPRETWERVQSRLQDVSRTWPGAKGKRGFSEQQGGRVAIYPTHLLAGAMTCGVCGKTIAQVSGKNGGYYGCLTAAKGACDNRPLVQRRVAERIMTAALRDRISCVANIEHILNRVEEEVRRLNSDLPEQMKLKQAELLAEERKLRNFVEFIGEGRGSRALADALTEAERRAEQLRVEIAVMEHTQRETFRVPPGCGSRNGSPACKQSSSGTRSGRLSC